MNVYEDELSDAYLVRRIRRDDRHAFGVLVRRYDHNLRRVAVRLLAEPDQVDALMTQAYVKAWRSRGLARLGRAAGSSPAEWLYRTVYNTCIEEVRRQPPTSPPTGREPSPAPDPTVRMRLPKAPAERRMAALRALDPAERVPLVLVDGEGFSVDAAARILQRDAEAVARDVQRARRHWRELVIGKSEQEEGRADCADASPEAEKVPPGERAVRAALASLPVPEPGARFWSNLDDALLDRPTLRVPLRPAIRPITQMPSLGGSAPDAQDVFDDLESGGRGGRPTRRPPRSQSPGSSGKRRRRLIGAAVVVVLAGLLVVGSLAARTPEERTVTTGTTEPADDEPETEPEAESEPAREPSPPPTPPALAGLEPSVPLTSGGVGPLETGSMTLRDVTANVAEPEIDLPTFEGSGGTCYDARLPGAADLILRVRSADSAQGVADPLDGVLSSITITAEAGSSRETEVGIGLGSSEDALLGSHAGELLRSDNPFVPGGNIYLFRSPDGSGDGIAYVTDGRQVREISVGAADAVRLPQPC